MITDMHTHLLLPGALGSQALADMERCGVDPGKWRFDETAYLDATAAADRAFVFGLKAAKTGWYGGNEAVADFAARRADKYIFFASIDPTEPGFLDELADCRTRLGCRGVKLGPVYQGVHPHDPRYREIYAYCQEHGLPIITHMATTFSSGVPLEYARPIHMDAVACDFPALKIVLAHAGHPWEGEALAIVRKQENVYADVSALYYRPWQFYHTLRLAVEYGCPGKLLFGSDYPAATTAQSIEGLRSMPAFARTHNLPEIPEPVIEAIIHRDAAALLEVIL
jgi:hypothetical protein